MTCASILLITVISGYARARARRLCSMRSYMARWRFEASGYAMREAYAAPRYARLLSPMPRTLELRPHV